MKKMSIFALDFRNSVSIREALYYKNHIQFYQFVV